MSFTGKATYAELYPSTLQDSANEYYYEGSVFSIQHCERLSEEYYMLSATSRGMVLIDISTGKKLHGVLIKLADGMPFVRRCTRQSAHGFYVAPGDFRLRFDTLKFIGVAKDVLGLTVRAAYIANKCGR